MRKFALLTAILLVLTLFAFPVSADDALSRVIDDADLLTSSEEERLQNEIDSLIDKHGFDFVIVYVDSSARDYANDYGFGNSRDGILLLVSKAERDWYISTSGSGIALFSDQTIDSIGNDLSSELSDGEYYEAALTFLESSEAVLRGDYEVNKEFPLFAELIVVVLSLIAAIAIGAVVKRSMNTARKQTNASSYVASGSSKITLARDTFLYSTVSKVKIESNSSGSSHRSSSGRSHGGRGGRF